MPPGAAVHVRQRAADGSCRTGALMFATAALIVALLNDSGRAAYEPTRPAAAADAGPPPG